MRGHAAQEELKIDPGLVRPKYFVPIHGEYRHLMLHARLAADDGRRRRKMRIVMVDGDVLELDGENGEIVGTSRRRPSTSTASVWATWTTSCCATGST